MSGSDETLNKQYLLSVLVEKDADPDPFKQFDVWYNVALNSGLIFPNAFTLATSTTGGSPSARVLLLKGVEEKGFVFYTNRESRKGNELDDNPNAAMCFWWDKLERQVRIEGRVYLVSGEEADTYFHSRPEGSRIGAWASDQSRVIGSREELESKYREYEQKYKDIEIPRPQYWVGYRLIPTLFEFWQGRDNRLHDRLEYKLSEDGMWVIERLAP